MNEHDYALRDAAMAEFVDSYFNAHPQLTRDRLNELLVEAGFKAAWKPSQSERLEKAEAELARLREQEPYAWDCGGDLSKNKDYTEWFSRAGHGNAISLYAAPVPAVAAPAVLDVHGIEDQLTLAATEMLNARTWSVGATAKRRIDLAMTAIGCARALLQSATQSGSETVAHHPV